MKVSSSPSDVQEVMTFDDTRDDPAAVPPLNVMHDPSNADCHCPSGCARRFAVMGGAFPEMLPKSR